MKRRRPLKSHSPFLFVQKDKNDLLPFLYRQRKSIGIIGLHTSLSPLPPFFREKEVPNGHRSLD